MKLVSTPVSHTQAEARSTSKENTHPAHAFYAFSPGMWCDCFRKDPHWNHCVRASLFLQSFYRRKKMFFQAKLVQLVLFMKEKKNSIVRFTGTELSEAFQGGLLINLRMQVLQHWALPLLLLWVYLRRPKFPPDILELEKYFFNWLCMSHRGCLFFFFSCRRDMQKGIGMWVWVSGVLLALTLITQFTCCFDFTGLDFNVKTLLGLINVRLRKSFTGVWVACAKEEKFKVTTIFPWLTVSEVNTERKRD